MSTEYHQLPSQQGLMPIELLTETDPWLIAATSNLSLDAWTPNKAKSSRTSLFEHAGHDSSVENAWNSVALDTTTTKVKSPIVGTITNSVPNVPKEFFSTSSKIDAWTVQTTSPLLSDKKKALKQQPPQTQQTLTQLQQEAEDAEVKAIEDELALQNRYKTELCKSYTETGICRYGTKCQFAHGKEEVRPILRHPKYKTETCKTFHSTGTCPYGIRCRFIHTRAKDDSLVVFSEEEMMGGKVPPPPVPQWSKSWTPSATVAAPQKKISKKHGLGKITLVEAVPDF